MGKSTTRKPFIIPVFIPHDGCPHRCGFCNQHVITGKKTLHPKDLFETEKHILKFLSYNKKKRPAQIAFYGGNFLGQTKKRILDLLNLSQAFINSQRVHGIRFSTRPDTITHKNLQLINPFPVQDIEIGTQSMENIVLRKSVRGHGKEDTETAARRIKESGIRLGIQMMIGLPGESSRSHRISAERIVKIQPDFVRIYPTVVLKGSLLEKLFNRGKYHALSLQKAILLTKELYWIFFHAQIPVIRMGVQVNEGLGPTQNIIAGPYHPAFGHSVFSEIYLDSLKMALQDQKDKSKLSHLKIVINPREFSRFQGLKKNNLHRLKLEFGIENIQLLPDIDIPMGSFFIFGKMVSIFIK